jgi:CubicO group peptidase (beta-lactamase class C family)
MDINGFCDPRFEPVRAAFAENWDVFDEVGASVAITLDGRSVVDLWGGWADGARTRPWERDTMVLVASTTKGFTGLCGNMVIERGLLDPDVPVARYWPEFAANGKADVPVKYLFDHRVGLPDVPSGVAIHDWDAMTAGLAAAAPRWEPGTAHAYHSMTYGHLVGELIRRVTGMTVGTFFRTQVCEPLGADAWIGVPHSEQGRIADLVGASAPFTDPEWVEAEIPAANGHANGRSLARIYGALACGGELDGVHLLERSTIDDALQGPATGPWFGWTTDMLAAVGVSDSLFSLRFARGFVLNSEFAWMGPNPNAFGYGGSGGSFAFADTDARVGFGYAQNAHIGQGQHRESRPGRIADAFYACL